MSTATPAQTVERTFKPLQQFTRGWMMAEATDTYGVEVVGMRTGREFWVVGRAGVMGSCTWETAAGALAFHAPGPVQAAWTNLPEGLTHLEVARHYASRVVAWGEEALTPNFAHPHLERIETLGRRIADAAPSALGPIFAGWRALPRPDGVGARVALTTQVLREMRGAAHLHAVLACGLSPLDAILASTNAPPRTGPGYAERMGFTGPFRDPAEVREPRREAETLTARIMEGYYAVLSPEELADFGELVETTRNAIDM
jgi:hypothetical protein